mmetsp:Transcript_34509/g.83286  ORF Transcript_34509/g.83286 Transcript_34509/m.83286 type:complete len:201 (+) Transcript_34509:299-901(+)
MVFPIWNCWGSWMLAHSILKQQSRTKSGYLLIFCDSRGRKNCCRLSWLISGVRGLMLYWASVQQRPKRSWPEPTRRRPCCFIRTGREAPMRLFKLCRWHMNRFWSNGERIAQSHPALPLQPRSVATPRPPRPKRRRRSLSQLLSLTLSQQRSQLRPKVQALRMKREPKKLRVPTTTMTHLLPPSPRRTTSQPTRSQLRLR